MRRFVFALSLASSLAAQSDPYWLTPTATPEFIPVGRQTAITIVARPLRSGIFPAQVLLRSSSSEGKLGPTLGRLNDDGLDGDSAAKDGIYTISLTLAPQADQDFRFRVTGVFEGSRGRVESSIVLVSAVASEQVIDAKGGRVGIADLTDNLYGTTMTIPPGALSTSQRISMRNLRPKPTGEDSAAPILDLQPDGLIFGRPVVVTFHVFSPANGDPTVVRAYHWSDNHPLGEGRSENTRFLPLPVTQTEADTYTVQITHFSFIVPVVDQALYTVMHLPGKYLQESDLLYALYSSDNRFDWIPGHAALYLGTQTAIGTSNDGETLVESIPNSIRFGTLSSFQTAQDHLFMGARRPKAALTETERGNIAAYALGRLGAGYALVGQSNWYNCIYILGIPWHCAGYSCVGLTEAAYDSANRSIIPPYLEVPWIFPLDQFRSTSPVDTITIRSNEPLLPIKVTGILDNGSDRYEIVPNSSLTASGLREGMYFADGRLYWPRTDKPAGSYRVDFFSTGFRKGQNITVKQSLTINVEGTNSTPCTTTLSSTNASKWFGGDPRNGFGPRNVGTGQAFTPPRPFALTDVSVPLSPLDPGAGSLSARMDLRNSLGNVLQTATQTLAYTWTLPHARPTQTLSFPISAALQANTTYYFTWWLPQGYTSRVAFGSDGNTDAALLTCGNGLTADAQQNDLTNWSLWQPHPWDFAITIGGIWQ